jgi:hypothetical protein
MNQPQQEKTDDIDLLRELSSDQASRDHWPQVAGYDPLTSNDPQPIGAVAPPIDDEQTISEVEVRERLIEWLVGFLPGGPQADQAAL